jgi:hypothetical protein
LQWIAFNSLWRKDYGYHRKTEDDHFCIKGKRLGAKQFTNFLAGYGGQTWDDVNGSIFPGLALGTVQNVGVGWHVLASFFGLFGSQSGKSFSEGYDDTWDSRGLSDIQAGAAYARDPSAALLPGSGYSNCGCK